MSILVFGISCRLPSASLYNPSDPIDGNKVNDHVEHEIRPENESENVVQYSEQILLNDVQSFDDVPDTGQTDVKSNPQPSSSASIDIKKSAIPSSNTAIDTVASV